MLQQSAASRLRVAPPINPDGAAASWTAASELDVLRRSAAGRHLKDSCAHVVSLNKHPIRHLSCSDHVGPIKKTLRCTLSIVTLETRQQI